MAWPGWASVKRSYFEGDVDCWVKLDDLPTRVALKMKKEDDRSGVLDW
jgi:hypothetical protein